MPISDYLVTIGLEVHCQIKTETKMFCSCKAGFGYEPNTNVCPTCLGMPGALPVLNEYAIERTVLTGMMLGCSSPEVSKWDRKNYFYADMPKNYQTSQLDLPLCIGGEVPLYSWAFPQDSKVKADGAVFTAYLMMNAIMMFVLEMVRADKAYIWGTEIPVNYVVSGVIVFTIVSGKLRRLQKRRKEKRKLFVPQ